MMVPSRAQQRGLVFLLAVLAAFVCWTLAH
jgi:hypothetical protein